MTTALQTKAALIAMVYKKVRCCSYFCHYDTSTISTFMQYTKQSSENSERRLLELLYEMCSQHISIITRFQYSLVKVAGLFILKYMHYIGW